MPPAILDVFAVPIRAYLASRQHHEVKLQGRAPGAGDLSVYWTFEAHVSEYDNVQYGTYTCQLFLTVQPLLVLPPAARSRYANHACLQLLQLTHAAHAVPPQGQALREVEGQTLKSCDTDRGGCGRDQQVRFFLEGTPPAAFTLQLAWERNQESAADIRDTMATIQEVRAQPAVP